MTLRQARAGTASGVLPANDTSCDVAGEAARLLTYSLSHAMCMALPEHTSAQQSGHRQLSAGSQVLLLWHHGRMPGMMPAQVCRLAQPGWEMTASSGTLCHFVLNFFSQPQMKSIQQCKNSLKTGTG